MKRTFLVIAIICVMFGAAMADGVVGQSVLYRYNSSHTYPAILTADNGDTTWHLVALDTDGYATGFPMGAGSQAGYATIAVDSAAEDDTGTNDNRWRPNPSIGLGEQGPTGATGATGSTGATGATGPGALVSSSGTTSFSLNGSAIQLDATHDVELTMSISFSLPLSLVAGATGTVHLFCDSSSNPATEVETVSRGNAGGLLTTDTSTLPVVYRVKAADFCKVTSTQDVGSPTFSIVRQGKQVLGN
jgi:hypothetical protein